MASKAAHLYDEDFYAWTQQQAEALRTHFKGDNRIDVEHLAEEVEDLGKSELHAVESYIEQIIAHLLKLDYSSQAAPRPHWRAEVVNFRHSAARRITPCSAPTLTVIVSKKAAGSTSNPRLSSPFASRTVLRWMRCAIARNPSGP